MLRSARQIMINKFSAFCCSSAMHILGLFWFQIIFQILFTSIVSAAEPSRLQHMPVSPPEYTVVVNEAPAPTHQTLHQATDQSNDAIHDEQTTSAVSNWSYFEFTVFPSTIVINIVPALKRFFTTLNQPNTISIWEHVHFTKIVQRIKILCINFKQLQREFSVEIHEYKLWWLCMLHNNTSYLNDKPYNSKKKTLMRKKVFLFIFF